MAISSARKPASESRAVSKKSSATSVKVRKKALGRTVSGRSVRGVQRRKVLAISAFSVAKVCFLFFITLLVVFIIAGAVLWNFAGASGLILKLNHFVDQLIGSATYHVSGTTILIVFAGLGIVLSIIATIIVFVATMLFNLAAEYIGGISVLIGLDDTNI